MSVPDALLAQTLQHQDVRNMINSWQVQVYCQQF